MNDNISIKEYGEIKIIDRKRITLTGIRKLISFNNKEFVIDSKLGLIILKGDDLELLKLDTSDGNLAIKGRIDSLSYMDETKKEISFISRLFK
ncbi:MAG: sporulation protein YabP [Firmicutes bacterium]|nr:sporulation protein YabP [Bacillota bacterium]